MIGSNFLGSPMSVRRVAGQKGRRDMEWQDAVHPRIQQLLKCAIAIASLLLQLQLQLRSTSPMGPVAIQHSSQTGRMGSFPLFLVLLACCRNARGQRFCNEPLHVMDITSWLCLREIQWWWWWTHGSGVWSDYHTRYSLRILWSTLE